MKKFWLHYKTPFRILLGGLIFLIGAIWLCTPIPGAPAALIYGLQLINPKLAKKAMRYFRKKWKH